jgi:hypothetical protein
MNVTAHTVCQVWWDGQCAFLIETHAKESLVPATDDLAQTDCKNESW